MTIDHGWNADRQVNLELCLPAQCTDSSVHLSLHEQDPETLELLHLEQKLIPNPEGAIHRPPGENHSVRLGADSHPGGSLSDEVVGRDH